MDNDPPRAVLTVAAVGAWRRGGLRSYVGVGSGSWLVGPPLAGGWVIGPLLWFVRVAPWRPSLIHGYGLCGRHDLGEISRRFFTALFTSCIQIQRECDRLSGQSGVDIVHTLYTGGRGTYILVLSWNSELRVISSSWVQTFCAT